jgi:hypothetical protein
MDVIDGSAAGIAAATGSVGELTEAGGTDQSQGRESRELASYGFNRGANNMDFCFHLFFSISFLAVHSFLPKNLRRVTKNFGRTGAFLAQNEAGDAGRDSR